MLRAANAYRNVDLESAPNTQIVERLFDRFARDITEAKAAIAARDIKAKAATLDHATQIVVQLRAALDRRVAPELVAQLDSLYAYVIDRLFEANMKLSTPPLDHAASVMVKLGDAFRRAHQALR